MAPARSPSPSKADRRRADGCLARADAARDRGDWAAAADAYAEALALLPGRQPLWVQLGHVRKEAGDLAGAERAYGRALRLDASDVDAWLNAAHLLKRRERWLDAARAFERVERLGLAAPGLAEERDLLRRRGFEADGEAPAMADEPAASPDLSSGTTGGGRSALAQADAARDRRDWTAAAQGYEEALRRHPARKDLWVQLGHVRKEGGDLPGAEAAYGRALQLDASDFDLWLNIALLFKRLDRLQAAADAYAQAERLGADRGDPQGELRALAARGVSPGATPPQVGAWTPEIRLAPAAPGAPAKPTASGGWIAEQLLGGAQRRRRAARAAARQGDAARDRRDWSAAAAAYREALASDAGMTHIRVQLGHALKEGGDAIGAEAAYREALRAEPDNGDTWLNLGHLLKLQGRWQEAVAAYREAVEREPERETWRAELMAALQAVGPDASAQPSTGQPPTEAVDPLVRLVRELGQGGSAARLVAGLPPARAAELIAGLEPSPQAMASPSAGARLSDLAPPEGDAPAIWFDVTDLMGFFLHQRLPTGIQRVQIETVSAALREPPGGRPVGVCVFSEETSRWSRCSPQMFAEIARLALASGDSQALNWRLALGRLELSLSVAGPLEFGRGDILINLGAAWSQGNHDLALRAEKARSGLLYMPCVFDLIPVLAPGFHVEELTRAYLAWLKSLLVHADGVFCISRHTLEDLRRASAMLGAPLPGDREEVMPLNAAMTTDRAAPADGELLRRLGLTPGGFVLFVSTIEPRKGHMTAFGAWEQLVAELGDRAPKLVCAGRLGWMQESTVARLKASPALRDKVQLASGLSDRDLHTLYKSCAFTLYASIYEGWGLPITESLSYGKVPLISDHPSMREAGAGVAELFETGSERSLAAAAARLWTDADLRARAEQRVAQGFRPRRWEDVAAQVVAAAERWRADASREPRAVSPLALALGRHYPLGHSTHTTLSPDRGSGEVYRRGEGWMGPEPWGCWSKPGDCMLAFSVEPTEAPLRVYLGLRAPPPQSCRYRVLLGGETLAEGVLPQNASRWVCRTLPGGAAATGEITLLITSNAEWVVRDQPHPVLAGLGVTGLMVCEESDLLARSAFMEEHMREELALLA